MLIQALTSFVGAVDMNISEVREVDDSLARPLIANGLAKEIPRGDADENIGNNGRRRKKGAEN